MAKLLWFGLLAAVVYLLLRSSRRRGQRSAGTPPAAAERMVACAQCGVNLPESESLKSGQHYYCCERHRGLGPLVRKH